MLAIIPGTSRSGATIVGGLLLGLSRACVAEFTPYLAIPVTGRCLSAQGGQVRARPAWPSPAPRLQSSWWAVRWPLVNLAAIRFLMDYVKRHNFKFFGLYRIVLGLVVLAVAAISAIA